MQKIDDFLVDQVFQKISNLIYPFISCYGIASFFLTGACIFLIIDIAIHQTIMIIFMFIVLLYWSVHSYQAMVLDKSAREGIMPINRIRDMPIRMIYLLFVCIDIFEITMSYIVLHIDVFKIQSFSDISWLFATIGFFFMACRKIPPVRKTSNVFSFMKFSNT